MAGSNYYGVRDSVNLMRSSIDQNRSRRLSGEVHQDTSLNNYSTWTFDGKKTGSLADFLAGQPASFWQDTPVTKIDNDWYASLYIQDDFRITQADSQFGAAVRVADVDDRPARPQDAFAPGVKSTIAPNAPLGLLFPGDPGIGGIINPSRKMFAPRFGLAWDPSGDGKTSIRRPPASSRQHFQQQHEPDHGLPAFLRGRPSPT